MENPASVISQGYSVLNDLEEKIAHLPQTDREKILPDLERLRSCLNEAEQDLQASEERFQILADYNPLLIWMSDAQGNNVFINQTYREFLGASFEETHGVNWQRFLDPTDAPAFVEAFQLAVRESKTFQGQIRVRRADGEWRYLGVYAEPRFATGGTFLGHVGFSMDITDRKQAEERLTYQATLLELVSDAIIEADDQAIITYWNQAAERLYGWSQSDALGQNVIQLFRSDLSGEERERMLSQLQETGNDQREFYHYTKDGRRLLIDAQLAIHRDPSGQVIGYLSANRDMTERKQADDALKNLLAEVETEKNRLVAVMDALPIGVAILDAQGGLIQSNQAFAHVWGGPRPIPRSVDDYAAFKAWWLATGEPVHPEEWASAQAIQKGETVIGQLIEIQRFNGTRGIILNSAAPIYDAQGQITGCAVAIMEITEQKRLEREQQEQQFQVEIQRRLLDNRDQERQSLARDIHDGPVQDLSSLLFNIQFAKEALSDQTMQLELDQIALRLKSTIQELRGTINEMRPPSLIRFGLAKAINVYLEEFREKHPEIELDSSLMDDGRCLSEPSRLGLYRILQEALNNVNKHSGANRVNIVFSCEAHQTILEIQDDGKGFTLHSNLVNYSNQGHYGLVGIKERAEAIGGSLEIDTVPNKGTTIRVIVPKDA